MTYLPKLTRTRGRAAYGKDWPQFRMWFLFQHPRCEDCKGVADVVDHIIPVRVQPELVRTPSNLRALCCRCHNRRTGYDQNASRKDKALPGCSSDGLPLDPNHPFFGRKK